jgi:hypothetical protein
MPRPSDRPADSRSREDRDKNQKDGQAAGEALLTRGLAMAMSGGGRPGNVTGDIRGGDPSAPGREYAGIPADAGGSLASRADRPSLPPRDPGDGARQLERGTAIPADRGGIPSTREG